MARGGNNAITTELKVLRGTLRPSRTRDSKKVKVPLVSLPCPQWLSPVARTEWKRVVPELFKAGLLARIDLAALAAYCENYAIVVQCAGYIRRRGGYAKYLAGKNSQTAPHVTAMNKAAAHVRAFCTEFGMTPSSRGRMQVPEAPDSGDEDLD